MRIVAEHPFFFNQETDGISARPGYGIAFLLRKSARMIGSVHRDYRTDTPHPQEEPDPS
ncbi:MAG TPA: hypothetical protein PLE73_03765 [Spirochaetota bacterium]|nr:hypothetical protein [Spirochaetota bacterium]HPI22286.1 hypothetical protein [Spirochaetota bacterium]